MEEDKIDYFMRRTDDRMEIIEKKIDILLGFRWQIVGGSVAVSSIISLIIVVIGLAVSK